jgi:predicted nucleic acid-binding protein
LITYVDASVLLRVIQGAPNALNGWSGIEPVSSRLIMVECLRVVDRARLQADADEMRLARDRASVLEALATFQLAPLDDAILERAGDPFPTSLGTLDAIHLATALELRRLHPAMPLATHDAELATAAHSLGFEVVGV